MNIPKIQLAGGGERAQYMLHEYNDNTIRFVLNYPGQVDPDILRLATKQIVEGADILHGTFCSDALSTYWNINEKVSDINYFQYVRTAGDPAVTAYSLSLLPIAPDGKVQLRTTLVQSDTASSVVVCISHLCVDGGDGKYLLGKLIEAYNLLLQEGTADRLEIKSGSRAPEQVYENLNFKEFMSLLNNPLSSVNTAYPYPSKDAGMARIVHREIPASVMAEARRKAKESNATVNDLLVAAFYQAYASMPEVDETAAMSVTSMMDLRRHCKNGESEGLCNMSGSLPTTLEHGVREEFCDTLAEVTAQTRAAKENPLAGLEGIPLLYGATRMLPTWMLAMAASKIYGKMALGLTNLGNLSCESLALGNLVPKDGIFGGPVKKKPGMQISAISFDGTCILSVVGQYTSEDADVLQATLEKIVGLIRTYAEKKS